MVQADGKPVMSGIGSNTFAVARYNQNGTIDTSFDGDGIAVTPMSPGGASAAYSLSLLADGRIVAGGETSDGTNLDFAVARYISNGSLDASFDGDGKAITQVLAGDDRLGRIAVQSDGKIVAAGYVQNGPNLDMALVRYNTDGSLDGSYGLLGKAITDLGIYDYADGLALDAADRALVVTPGAGGGFTTARFTSDFAPLVDVGGRVTSTNGQGISGAAVIMTNANDVSQTARTNAFGYYSFSGVSSNEIYTVRVSSKRFRFQPSSQTVTVTGSLSNVDFIGNPGSESKNTVTVEEKITVQVKETGRKKPG